MSVGKVYYDEIHLTVSQQFRTFHGCLIDYLDMCSGKRFVETFKIRNQKVAADCITGSYADLSAVEAASIS